MTGRQYLFDTKGNVIYPPGAELPKPIHSLFAFRQLASIGRDQVSDGFTVTSDLDGLATLHFSEQSGQTGLSLCGLHLTHGFLQPVILTSLNSTRSL